MDKVELPYGSADWQWRHQNYARLLLKAGVRSNGGFCRKAIISVLDEVERIQGPKQREILSAFLNHEKQSIADGVELIKPQSVISQERAYQEKTHDYLSKDDRYEQHKQQLAASDKFIERLAS